MIRNRLPAVVCAILFFLATCATAPQAFGSVGRAAVIAGTPLQAGTLSNRAAPGPIQAESLPWSIVILLTVLTLLPTLLLAMTPFTRLLVVFHFLRQAIGTQSTPTNQIMIALALILTFFIMQPVVVQIDKVAIEPYQKGSMTAMQAVDKGSEPLRHFMLRFAREKDLALFVEIANQPRPRRPDDLPMRIVAPAYLISELRTGFQIGVVLFLPFLVVDLVVASVTTSVGMLQLPPVVISTPLKIMLFVMVDGWHLLIGSLVKSFY